MNRDWQDAGSADYDILIVVCGYEERASFVPSNYTGNCPLSVVLDYRCPGIGSYDQNHRKFMSLGSTEWLAADEAPFKSELDALLARQASLQTGLEMRVLFDISSCSRSVMANVLLALSDVATVGVRLTCAYAVSEFFTPPEYELPTQRSEPVIGDLSGWSSDLSKPPCAIIGLGFEPGRALGSIDYLEVPEVRLFKPEGPDLRFGEAVIAANRLLIEETNSATLTYDVMNPADISQKLDSLIMGLRSRFRPIIIPLGPKIFAAIAMLLAIRLLPEVCVWRTTAGDMDGVVDRSAVDNVVVFDHLFQSRDDT